MQIMVEKSIFKTYIEVSGSDTFKGNFAVNFKFFDYSKPMNDKTWVLIHV
tara:strand:- start:5162 stop:5311 length:150 start_codon:yes stop_codon:yes gene_type:complete